MTKLMIIEYLNYLLMMKIFKLNIVFIYFLWGFFLLVSLSVYSQNTEFDWIKYYENLGSTNQLTPQMRHDMAKYERLLMNQVGYGGSELISIGNKIDGYWHIIDQDHLMSGLNYTLYERQSPSGRIEWDFNISGTETKDRSGNFDPKDWISNLNHGADLTPSINSFVTERQYKDGLDFVKKYLETTDRSPNHTISVSGHSLGGGIAQYIAKYLGIRGYVANAVALTINTSLFTEGIPTLDISSHQFELSKSNISNLVVRYEPVQILPGKHYGERETINGVDEIGNLVSRLDKLKLHSNETIITSYEYHIKNKYNDNPKRIEREMERATNIDWNNSNIPIYSIPLNSNNLRSNIQTTLNLVPNIKNFVVVGSGSASNQMTSVLDNKIEARKYYHIEYQNNLSDIKQFAQQVEAKAIILFPKHEIPQNKPPTIIRNDVYFDFTRTTTVNSPLPPPSGKSWESANRVGGVMLSDVAELSGDNINSDNFSLIFENEEGIIDIEELRRFITALWAVYFGKEVPGISIDPISPDIDKHLVRYIGHVINLDIGRVMRETDYKMKEWAVGTSKPDIEGFKNVDELSMIKGIRYLGASRRFWFVPEEMKFQLMGDVLVFESGRMTLKTEYIGKANQAEPADIAFAKFFTENYDSIASKYPIYADLFDYAKLVSFSRYLEEKNIPLLWFLLANKDLVLTEDSPGTVDAFAKKSDYLEYVWIEGGVELGDKSMIGNYVFDEEATKALQKSLATYKINELKNDNSFYMNPIVLNNGKKGMTYAPSNSLFIGSEKSKNEKYNTDIFIREGKSKNLELVRYYNPNYQGLPTIGKNWHLMIPYQIKPFGDGNIIWEGNLFSPNYLVNNLLTGKTDTLSFNDQRYSVVGYVPKDSLVSNLIGLFFLTDGSLRLADKVGVEYQFDNGLMSQMIISEDYFFQYDYGYEVIESQSLNYQPYNIKPKKGQVMIINKERIPSILRLIDYTSGDEELFIFDKNNEYGVWGYSPIDVENSKYKILGVMQDASYLLVDAFNNEISFDSGGNFQQLKSWVVKSFTKGDLKVDFDYGVFGGHQYIVKATLKDKKINSEIHWVEYQHDKGGNLKFVHTKDGKKIKIENEIYESKINGFLSRKYIFILFGLIGILGLISFWMKKHRIRKYSNY